MAMGCHGMGRDTQELELVLCKGVSQQFRNGNAESRMGRDTPEMQLANSCHE